MNTQEQQDLDELEAILFRIEGTVLPVTSGFQIDTPDKAAWAGRKIVEAENRIEKQRAIADEYKRRIDEWFIRSTKDDSNTIDYLRGIVKPFAVTEIRSLKKGKTLKYFGVSFSMRKHPDKTDVYDEEKAILYCEKHHPEVVEVKKSLSRSALKKTLAEGYDIPGVDLLKGSEELYITGEAEQIAQKTEHAA